MRKLFALSAFLIFPAIFAGYSRDKQATITNHPRLDLRGKKVEIRGPIEQFDDIKYTYSTYRALLRVINDPPTEGTVYLGWVPDDESLYCLHESWIKEKEEK